MIAALFRKVRTQEVTRVDAVRAAADFKTDCQIQYQIMGDYSWYVIASNSNGWFSPSTYTYSSIGWFSLLTDRQIQCLSR